MKRKATRFDASGLEAKLGAFFEKSPAKKRLAGKRREVFLADM